MHTTQTQTQTHFHQTIVWGVVILVIANICFSAKAVLIKLLYKEGVPVQSVIALRMIFSLPFYAIMAVWLHRRTANVRLTGREWLIISALGILSYYISSMLDFLGLQYVTAGVERLVLYTYPTLVLLLSAWLFKKRITRTQVLALLLTYTGVAIAFVAENGVGDQKDIWKGGMLVFSCAITYSVYMVFTGQYAGKVGSAKFTSYAVMAATVPALLQSAWIDGLDIFHYSTHVYGLSLWLAVIATVLPTFLIVEGIRVTGAGNAGIIGFVGPVSTIFLAWLFLDEPVTVMQLVGTVVVLAGILLLTRKAKIG